MKICMKSGAALVGVGALASLVAIQTASADVIVTIEETGGGVKMSYSAGTLDTSGLSAISRFTGGVNFYHGVVDLIGGGAADGLQSFTGDIAVSKTGGWTLGTGSSPWSSTTGNGGLIGSEAYSGVPTVFIVDDDQGAAFVGVNSLSGMTGTVNGASFASLGLTDNASIKFTWAADSLTFTTVPTPGALALLGLAALGASRRRTRA